MVWTWECGRCQGKNWTLESNRHELKYSLHCLQAMWPREWGISTELVFPSVRVSQYHFLHMADMRIKWDQIWKAPLLSTELSSLIRSLFSLGLIKKLQIWCDMRHFYHSVILEIEAYNRATVLKTVWYSFKNRHIDQWYRLRIPQNCLIHRQK